MNILFFLTPKNDVAFIYSDANLREAIDLMEAHGYSALPILTKQGRYAGTLTEGDLLWYMKSHLNQSLKDMELISVMEVKRRQDNSPVNAGAKMEDLLDKAMQQIFVPVLDDNMAESFGRKSAGEKNIDAEQAGPSHGRKIETYRKTQSAAPKGEKDGATGSQRQLSL